MKKGSSIAKNLVVVIMIGLAVACVFMSLISKNDSPRTKGIAGYRPLIVLSGSMAPAMKPGELIISKGISAREIRVGDIITFRTPRSPADVRHPLDTLTTHRVVRIEQKADRILFETKGDANRNKDAWQVPAVSVVGRLVATIPFLGWIMAWARTSWGFISLIIVPGIIVIVIELRRIITSVWLSPEGV